MLTETEVIEIASGSRLYMTTVDILVRNEMDVGRALPELVATVHGNYPLMLALMRAASIDPVTGQEAPYHDEQLTHNLMHLYAKQVAASRKKEAGDGSDV